MSAPSRSDLVNLETKFWQSMVDQDTEVALNLLDETALMVNAHGIMKFDHVGYRQMADAGPMVLTSFELSDLDVLFPNEKTAVVTYRVKQTVCLRGNGTETSTQEMNDSSTWVQVGMQWKCVMHTETPANLEAAASGS
jgi:hypothetical protein